ncbi:hypothetical protein BH10CYA1_BH10CYA1_63210 [soil metagenome]
MRIRKHQLYKPFALVGDFAPGDSFAIPGPN